jgi:hypothetical protein
MTAVVIVNKQWNAAMKKVAKEKALALLLWEVGHA